MRNLLWVIAWCVLIGGILFAWGIWRADRSYGIASLWTVIAGPPDLGPVDFAKIKRSPTGNDALFCPPGLCGSARVDGLSPVFAVPVARLRDAVRVIEVNDPDVFALARDEARTQDRYLARTHLMRFPDTINVRFHDLGDGRSTLSIHSRSQLGRKDFGVNKERIETWIGLLGASLPVVQP